MGRMNLAIASRRMRHRLLRRFGCHSVFGRRRLLVRAMAPAFLRRMQPQLPPLAHRSEAKLFLHHPAGLLLKQLPVVLQLALQRLQHRSMALSKSRLQRSLQQTMRCSLRWRLLHAAA